MNKPEFEEWNKPFAVRCVPGTVGEQWLGGWVDRLIAAIRRAEPSRRRRGVEWADCTQGRPSVPGFMGASL
ncbi:hypothetical protein EYF80_015048 [Liparis tanakae]|uniref:Uncharacterized protein n=1 Tax=Liparis tanakae TaxID=230148 RepID=A0A4Z2IA21_9TELE|nr:hypothetical protein EYF80_015048 [Liparis tanakae]